LIARQIEKYGFSGDIDYIKFLKNEKNSNGGRPSDEYNLTLDMAKELCMIERSQRDKK
jgi:anti-repressor protein